MKHWYALYTKPKKERHVKVTLQGQDIEVFLPTVRRKRRRRDRPDRIVFFPCYLFARIDFDETPLSSIAWMPGVRRIVTIGSRPAIVADEIVNTIRRRLGDIEEVGYGKFKKGDRVRITTGPLRDLEAVFDEPLSSADRVRILLDVMGRMTPVDIDPLHLQQL